MTEDIEYLITLTKSHIYSIIWLDFEIDDNKESIEYIPIISIKFQKIDNDFISTNGTHNESLVNYLVNNQITSIVSTVTAGRNKKYMLKLTHTALLTLL
jgi:hypothetical protein